MYICDSYNHLQQCLGLVYGQFHTTNYAEKIKRLL